MANVEIERTPVEGEAARAAEPTTNLIREAIVETRELVRLEVALAREDLRGELAAAKTGGIALGVAAVLGLVAVTMFFVALALAFDVGWLAALVIGGALVAVAAAAALWGYRALPKKPMDFTRDRLRTELTELKGRIA